MSARLHLGGAPLVEPAARLDRPGPAVVYLTEAGTYGAFLAFTASDTARELAAAITRPAELLDGPQIVIT